MTKRHHLNLSASVWKRLRRDCGLRPTPYLLWQTLVTGPLLTSAARMQAAELDRRGVALPESALFILGYWRSGTTLLHELLSCAPQFCMPTTEACMNPHNFLLRSRAGGRVEKRPMDDMEISADSPQEDEFALMSLGARSPYEALLVPQTLRQALMLCDPEQLTGSEREELEKDIRMFTRAVCATAAGRLPVLKSPPHGCRIPLLSAMIPNAKFVLIVREPGAVFESAVRMWMKLIERYTITVPPDETMVREAIVATRPAYEAALTAGLRTLGPGRITMLRYEELAADPVASCERLFRELERTDFERLRAPLMEELDRRKGYRATNAQPNPYWKERLACEWKTIYDSYEQGYV